MFPNVIYAIWDQYLLEAIWVQNISSREIARLGWRPLRKGRQIRRLPETSGWIFVVGRTEKYCFIAFYADKRYFETKKVSIILLKSKFSPE